RTYGPKYVITVGLAFEATGIWIYALVFSSSTTFWQLFPGLMLHGIGIGFATSQLTNVVLSDIPPEKSGSASGAASMVRQVGTALGIALIGAIFVSQATSTISASLAAAPDIPQVVKDQVVADQRRDVRPWHVDRDDVEEHGVARIGDRPSYLLLDLAAGREVRGGPLGDEVLLPTRATELLGDEVAPMRSGHHADRRLFRG